MNEYEQIMVAYNAPTTLTVLKAVEPEVPMTKVFTKEGAESYQNAYLFDVKQFEVSGINDVYDAIAQLQSQPTTCIIRGVLKDGRTEAKGVYRLIKDKRGRKAEFEDHASKLLHLDIDGISAPEGLTLEEWPEYCVSQLPERFHNVSYIYQYSSSAGRKEGIRLHLWFYLAMPATFPELKRWRSHLTDNQQLLVDDAVFRPVQVNYIQKPIFKEGAEDPLTVERLGFVEKSSSVLSIVIPKKELRIREPLNTDIEYVRTHAGDPFNAFYKKVWQVEHSGRLHVPIFSSFSAYKWACEVTGSEENEDFAIETVLEAIQKSSHPDKDGVYSSTEYLEAQYRDAEIGTQQDYGPV